MIINNYKVRTQQNHQNGETKPFLPAPYNWKTYGDMNVKFGEKHQETLLEDSKKSLKQSHTDVMKMINGFTSESLFVGNEEIKSTCKNI